MEATALTTPFDSDHARLDAVRRRDPSADGEFFYGVITTGVYCRPSCAARPALRENIRFFASTEEAVRAGLRACKRCRPDQRSPNEEREELLARVRQRLETAGAKVSLSELAESVELSPYHLHRLFKKHVGMTPREYGAAVRLQKVGSELRDGASVTRAIHEAGYSSSSRFYEGGSPLGIAPRRLRGGADGVQMRALVRSCSLGRVLVAATSRGVCAIFFGDGADALEAELRERFPNAEQLPADRALEKLAHVVVRMTDTTEVNADVPLDLIGTAFQQRVWRALREIPSGETRTYSAIAKKLGVPGAARAVGSACGKNPVCVVVPCHRVVREDGDLGGYRWGIARKKKLLAKERNR
jgi:AraC family transcriptional regulator of adaptative response/methylated-DNA-[protein]-cysteine methyltransferase